MDGAVVEFSEHGGVQLVYNFTRFPGTTADQGLGDRRPVEMSDSMPVFELYEFCLAKPGSMA